MTEKHHGSCLCGQVKFEIDGDFEHFFLCHCSHCRKDTGSAHAANLFCAAHQLTWLAGQDLVTTYQLPDTRHGKSFCRQCGSALPRLMGHQVMVPAGALDSPLTLPPTAHLFMASRALWDHELAQLKTYSGLPT